jgi:hypothetical protein
MAERRGASVSVANDLFAAFVEHSLDSTYGDGISVVDEDAAVGGGAAGAQRHLVGEFHRQVRRRRARLSNSSSVTILTPFGSSRRVFPISIASPAGEA